MIRRFDILFALYIFGVLVAQLMGAKTFPLISTDWLHINASVAIFLVPFLFTITDVVVEVHGRTRARSMVFAGVAVAALLVVFASLATALPPSSRFAVDEASYDAVFASSARIAAASLIAFAAAELLDVAVFSKLRQKLHDKALWLRNNASNFVGQFADTVIFMTLAFYALDKSFSSNAAFLGGLIISYWLVKCVFSVVQTPLVYAGVRWLQKSTPKEQA